MERWTPAQDYDLLARWERGEPWSRIAPALGRSEAACQEHLRRLQAVMTLTDRLIQDDHRLERRRFSRRQENWLRRWHHDGLSAEHIARQLGCTAAEVCERLAVLEA